MILSMKRILLAFFCFLTLFSGCTGKNILGDALGVSAPGSIDGTNEPVKARAPHFKPADHQVLVMLGPDFAPRTAILDGMISEYGIAGSGGMTLQLFYPESFMTGNKASLSVLKDKAMDPLVSIIITVGAPERTVNELSRIRAARSDIKIVTLFQSDESLPTEAVSDLLIDYPVDTGLLADENTAGAEILSKFTDASLGALILGCALAEEKSTSKDSPLTRLNSGLETARTFMKLKQSDIGFTLKPYIDPDTTLRSRSHLVLSFDSGGTE